MTYFHAKKIALSSALERFTVLFGMGRGGSTPLWSSDIGRVRGAGIEGTCGKGGNTGRGGSYGKKRAHRGDAASGLRTASCVLLSEEARGTTSARL